jgi:hypothetical protein
VEVLAAIPQVIGPGAYCLARIQNDRSGWQPQATLNRSPALLAVCGCTYRESYLDIVMVAIVSSILALTAVILLGSLVGSF